MLGLEITTVIIRTLCVGIPTSRPLLLLHLRLSTRNRSSRVVARRLILALIFHVAPVSVSPVLIVREVSIATSERHLSEVVTRSTRTL